MSYSVVIPSNRSFHHIEPLLQSLATQVFQPSQIVIVYDTYATVEEFEEYQDSITTLF
jgi:NADH dehydrogenase FAD-containing subunit